MIEAVCHSCGCELLWVPHERTQRPAPVERAPHPSGRLLVDFVANTYRIVSSVVGDKRPLRRNHFETCPNAHMHRRRAS